MRRRAMAILMVVEEEFDRIEEEQKEVLEDFDLSINNNSFGRL